MNSKFRSFLCTSIIKQSFKKKVEVDRTERVTIKFSLSTVLTERTNGVDVAKLRAVRTKDIIKLYWEINIMWFVIYPQTWLFQHCKITGIIGVTCYTYCMQCQWVLFIRLFDYIVTVNSVGQLKVTVWVESWIIVCFHTCENVIQEKAWTALSSFAAASEWQTVLFVVSFRLVVRRKQTTFSCQQ